MSTNALGDGYVECIADSTLSAIRLGQPEDLRGSTVPVPVLEGDGSARFGWKAQHEKSGGPTHLLRRPIQSRH